MAFDPNKVFSFQEAGFDKGQQAILKQYFPSGQIRGGDIGNVYGLLNTIQSNPGSGQQVNQTQDLAYTMLSQIGRQPVTTTPAPTAASPAASTNFQDLLNQATSGLKSPTAPTYFGSNATTQAPETTALQQMAQIDPASEALRQQLAASYAAPLSQATGPTAAQLQSYLNLYQQLDPQTYAAIQALGPQYQSYLTGSGQALTAAQQQQALGSQLDPITAMQVEQATRAAQGARGNVYGTPQLVEEAMTTGQAGLQLQQQRYQNLLSALGQQQSALGAQGSYLTSGATPGAIGLNLYQQNLANLRGAQQGALSYLGSGQTPYQAGAGYLANAQNAANAASQGFSYGQAAGLAPSYSYLNPAYGQQTAATAQGYYNTMANLYGQNLAASQAGGGGGGIGSALGGAVSGAASGAVLGSVVPGIGTVAGAIGGGILGGAGGLFA